MSECVARRAAAIGSLILPAVAPAAAHHAGNGANEFIRPGQLEDAAPLAAVGHGKHRHLFRSIESVSLGAAYGITNDNMVAIRIPHMRRSDLCETAKAHRGRRRSNNEAVVGATRPSNESRTAVARCFA